MTEADLGLALGAALGVRPVGSAGALRACLSGGDRALLIVGLRPGEPAPSLLGVLLDGVSWATAPPPASAVPPVAARAALLGFPAGLPGAPAPGLVETAPGRVALQIDPEASNVASVPASRAHAQAELGAALAVSRGGPCPAGLAWPDLMALDVLARECPATPERARAGLAGARLRLRWGQPAAAQLRIADVARLRLDAAEACLLARARAVLALHLGQAHRWRRAMAAAEELAEGLGPALLAGVAMERATALLSWWQDPAAAAAEFARAQLHWRALHHPSGRAEALCGEAWALLAQEQRAQARVRIVEAQQVGAAPSLLAPLLLQLGEPTPPVTGPISPERAAPVAMVRAVVGMRQGELVQARQWALQALDGHRDICHSPGTAAAQRLLGDISALLGQGAAADAWYRAALASHAAVHDRAGLGTTVRHALYALTGAPRIQWQAIATRLQDGAAVDEPV